MLSRGAHSYVPPAYVYTEAVLTLHYTLPHTRTTPLFHASFSVYVDALLIVCACVVCMLGQPWRPLHVRNGKKIRYKNTRVLLLPHLPYISTPRVKIVRAPRGAQSHPNMMHGCISSTKAYLEVKWCPMCALPRQIRRRRRRPS